MDTQQVELLGRNLLVAELVRAGVEVALPLRDRGVDLIAYIEIAEQAKTKGEKHTFSAVPIQMKAATREHFSVNVKYERIANLLLVYVWNVGGSANIEYYALTYKQAVGVADACGYTSTASWKSGSYSVNNKVGASLRENLQPFRMDAAKWLSVIRSTSVVSVK